MTDEKKIKDAVSLVSEKGRNGDTTLLHITPEELDTILAIGGPLTVNPETGLMEAFSLGSFLKGAVDPAGLFTHQGSSNPLATLTANVENPGQIAGGGVTPATVQKSLRVNPFGPQMSYFDVLGGGALAANPDVRKYGRLAGSALGAYFAAPAIASELGAGAGGATAAEAPTVTDATLMGGAGAPAAGAASDVGLGLTAPTAPSIAEMGGGTGLTTEAAGGGTLAAGGAVPANYGTSLLGSDLTAGGGAASALGIQGGGVPGVQNTATPLGTTVSPPAAPPAAPPPSTPPAGIGTQALNFMRQNASLLGLGGMALSGAASLRKPPTMPTSEQLSQLGTEAQGVAHQLIQQYQSGALSPGQQASLDQLTQQTKNQVNQYFSSIGQSDSTAHMQALAQIDQQAMVFKQQMLDNALSTGLQSIGIAAGPLTQVANVQLQQDANLRQAFGGFAGALGQFFGGMAGKQPATPAPASTGTTPVVQSATAP